MCGGAAMPGAKGPGIIGGIPGGPGAMFGGAMPGGPLCIACVIGAGAAPHMPCSASGSMPRRAAVSMLPAAIYRQTSSLGAQPFATCSQGPLGCW